VHEAAQLVSGFHEVEDNAWRWMEAWEDAVKSERKRVGLD